MNIAFFTNFMNHHQVYFCDALFEYTQGNFYFIELCNTLDLVKSMSGYSLIDRDYIIRPYIEGKKRAYDIAVNCDIMIFAGIESLPYVKARYKAQKNAFIFEYGERWLKKGLINIFSPNLLRNKWTYHMYIKKMHSYRLCASAYASYDERLLFSYKNNCLKWGYFTEIPIYDVKQTIHDRQRMEKVKILWIGRFLKWKHPEKVVVLARAIKKQNRNCEILMIGKGPMFADIKKQVSKEKLENIIHLKGTYSNSELLSLMRQCHILITTSDKNEGWGAVLNEGMAAACCPVASSLAGSTPYLIKNGINGYTFIRDEELIEKVIFLLDNPTVREQMMFNAYETVLKEWNPKCAASRFVNFCSKIMSGQANPFKDGPMSKA